MKPEELRIRNWVKDKYKDISGQIVRITKPVVDFESKEGRWNGISYDSIRPIPLTPEWLERFGFDEIMEIIEDKEGYEVATMVHMMINKGKSNSEFKLIQTIDGYWSLDGYETAWPKLCKYVHQLQNLYYALTGKELELKKDEIIN